MGEEWKNKYNWVETSQLITAPAYGSGVMHKVQLSLFTGYYHSWLTVIVNVLKLSADCEPVFGGK